MTFSSKDMEGVVHEFLAKSRLLLVEKARDYASNEDRLRNFRNVAAATGLTPEQVCLVFLHKHMDSIGGMVARQDYIWAWKKPDGSEGAKERILDGINYLLLLAAIMEDREERLKT